MQKVSFLVILALTLNSGFAMYKTENFNRSPQPVADDTELSFVNGTILTLTSNNDKLYLASLNLTAMQLNTSTDPWAVWLREIDPETFIIGENVTTTVSLAPEVQIHRGYAYSVALEMDDIPQLSVYQQSLFGGAPLPRVQLSRNTNRSHIPGVVATIAVDSMVYVFYRSAEKTVSVVGFEIGGGLGAYEFTLTTNYRILSLSVAKGEALSLGTVYAIWLEGLNTDITAKEATINLFDGHFNSSTIASFSDELSPVKAFSTDYEVYGGIFMLRDSDNTKIYFIKSNINSTLTYLTKTTNMFTKLADIHPYGENFVLIWEDVSLEDLTTTLSYEIWKGDASGVIHPKTNFINYDGASSHAEYLMPGKGLYSLVYDKSIYPTKLITNIKVGQVLEGAYMSSLTCLGLAALSFILLI